MGPGEQIKTCAYHSFSASVAAVVWVKAENILPSNMEGKTWIILKTDADSFEAPFVVVAVSP